MMGIIQIPFKVIGDGPEPRLLRRTVVRSQYLKKAWSPRIFFHKSFVPYMHNYNQSFGNSYLISKNNLQDY